MNITDVDELFYLVVIDTVPSIMELGILSNSEVKRLGISHQSIASDAIQKKRDAVRVPGGDMLHTYANLFICARNSMMFVVRYSTPHDQLAVLRVDPSVLNDPNVVIADGFAYSGWTLFEASPAGLANIDFEEVHARRWDHADDVARWRHKSRKSAEVLVPTKVPPDKILGAYASCEPAAARLRASMGGLDVRVAPYVFFESTTP
jgi:hypothetical protein